MSHARSASTGRCYGRARVLKAWGLPRSTFYQRRRLHASPRLPARRGPKTRYTDEQLVGETRRAIRESPFHGEGRRKVWARLRHCDVRTSLRRVLRLLRQHLLLAPQRQPQPVEPKRHDGTILARRPNQMWGIDATAGFTLRDGQVAIFAMIDHGSACCLGIHVAKRGTRFEALEPVRQAVREQFGGFSEGIALGVGLRHDHGSQFMSDDFQREIRFLGLESSPAFVREPEGNGCIERFFRTLKDELGWVRHFETLEELAEALEEFRQRYSEHRLVELLYFQFPRQAHQALLAVEPAA
ncbi:MAG: integrase [Bryobacteraceae bacterium]|nr:MAG: integrase [Bryobacteraceae bacterium]